MGVTEKAVPVRRRITRKVPKTRVLSVRVSDELYSKSKTSARLAGMTHSSYAELAIESQENGILGKLIEIERQLRARVEQDFKSSEGA